MSKIPQNMVTGRMLSDRINDDSAADSFTASLLPGDVVVLYVRFAGDLILLISARMPSAGQRV